MKDYILEVCVDSVESHNATEGGANRLELCGNLTGTSPSPLYKEVEREFLM